MSTSSRRRASNSLITVADYWQKNWQQTFPDLKASWIGWGEPFCFRCGWLVPVPGEHLAFRNPDPWAYAEGWLERAHLQDFGTGGTDEPSNIVPLCTLCHRGMPDFPDSRQAAIDWVKAQGHNSCFPYWQLFTDGQWGGEAWQSSPGRMVLVNAYIGWTRDYGFAVQAVECLVSGDRSRGHELLRLAGISAVEIQRIVGRYDRERALEVAAA